MKKIVLLFIAISFICCKMDKEKSEEEKENIIISDNSIENELKPGALKFNIFIKEKKDSLALVQAIYLAENYGDDGISHYANNIKEYLKTKGYSYDSIQKAVDKKLSAKYNLSSVSSSTALNSTTSYSNIDERANPCVISKDFIKQDLQNPSTADFSMFDCSTEKNSDGTYTILRKITAKNNYGVEKEFIYKLKLGFKGGSWTDMSNWDLIKIQSEEYK